MDYFSNHFLSGNPERIDSFKNDPNGHTYNAGY